MFLDVNGGRFCFEGHNRKRCRSSRTGSGRRFNSFVSVLQRLHGGTRGTVRGRLTAPTECYDISKVKRSALELVFRTVVRCRRFRWRAVTVGLLSGRPVGTWGTAGSEPEVNPPASEMQTGALTFLPFTLLPMGDFDIYFSTLIPRGSTLWFGVVWLLFLREMCVAEIMMNMLREKSRDCLFRVIELSFQGRNVGDYDSPLSLFRAVTLLLIYF